MAMTVWDRLQEQAVRAIREGTDADIAARQLLAAGGGDQRMVLATRLRLAAIAVICAGLAAMLAARRGWRGGSPTLPVPVTARRLAAGQVVLFAVLETVERLAVGAHPLSFLSSTQFAVGVVLQVAVALVAVVVLRGVERGAARGA